MLPDEIFIFSVGTACPVNLPILEGFEVRELTKIVSRNVSMAVKYLSVNFLDFFSNTWARK